MDSGNSGSIQSSSGGDEEYDDSRGESISTFLNNSNNNSIAHFGSIASHNNNNPPFLSHQQQHQQNPNNTFFDTAASLFPQSSNPQFNTNDLIWSSRALRSDHNFNNFTSSAPSSTAAASGQLFHHHNQNPFSGSGSGSLQAMQQVQPSIEATNVVRASSSAQPDVAKNPKKRTRASRRAPTTVLTTDTTNFRQMVQEFTGIPTAPFTGSPYTRRFDLFSTAGSGMRTGHLDSLGPLYPLRPSAQKVQVSPFMSQLSSSPASSSSLLSSSMIDALMPGNNSNSIVGVGTTSGSTSTNFQLGSNHLGIQKQAQNLFNMQNQILSFNAGASIFNTKSTGGGSSNTINVPSLDELGISHEQQVSANLISGFQGGNNSNNNSQARNDGNNLSRLWRNNNNHDGGQENQRLRSFDGNNSNAGNYNKLNSGNSSTSEFHPEINKGLENVCSTGEGPVSSWTCPD
ncbi:putative mediator of RNA polymerase II transcription subunit 26 [Solanum tuberosum]|uniref:VQ domain-containing protein n=1 Tax=Solanum tuberosum TaxID=4113 RepID=M1BI21_SOLTU|nr:PREDICTED: putative mediator of RNA polymerase II transcription subunit 26 [Solanum tuberosum]